jgi:hypothetical protein
MSGFTRSSIYDISTLRVKVTFFWGLTLSCLAGSCQRFGRNLCFHLHGTLLMLLLIKILRLFLRHDNKRYDSVSPVLVDRPKSTFSLRTSLNFIVLADIILISFVPNFFVFSFVRIVFSPILSAHTTFSFLLVSFSLHFIICCSPCHSQLDRGCFVQNVSVVCVRLSSHVTHCPPFQTHKALSYSLLIFHSIYCRSITTKQELISWMTATYRSEFNAYLCLFSLSRLTLVSEKLPRHLGLEGFSLAPRIFSECGCLQWASSCQRDFEPRLFRSWLW